MPGRFPPAWEEEPAPVAPGSSGGVRELAFCFRVRGLGV